MPVNGRSHAEYSTQQLSAAMETLTARANKSGHTPLPSQEIWLVPQIVYGNLSPMNRPDFPSHLCRIALVTLFAAVLAASYMAACALGAAGAETPRRQIAGTVAGSRRGLRHMPPPDLRFLDSHAHGARQRSRG